MYAFAPNGELYIDDLKVALFSYTLAKQQKSSFVLHLDDNDTKSDEIVALLGLFEIKPDEIIYQSTNLKFHRQFASKLLQDGKAFSCFCNINQEDENSTYDGKCKNLSDYEVLNNENPFTIRIKKPEKPISIHDNINGKLEVKNIDDFIILNQSKYPTRLFASSVDDMIYNTAHKIKSKEDLNSSAKEIHIKNSLGYNQEIIYTHIPPTIDNKSNKQTSVVWLLENGYLPEAIIDYLISLNTKTPKEIFTLNEAISWFSLEAISKSSEKFDIDRLNAINKEHIKLVDDIKLASMIGFSSLHVGKLAKIFTKKASTLTKLKEIIEQMFTKKEYPNSLKTQCEIFSNAVQKAPKFEKFDEFKSYILSNTTLSEDDFNKAFGVFVNNIDDELDIKILYSILKDNLKEITR